ncbi:ubiquitin conjugating enzyme ATG3 like [Trichuris trichiura]|uniref:Ubiquitin-like-conjugating enzyme ATG3 n=1 Tax=Trichuris trichiura TaxID=36087 RepID=A0A077ZB10_TRITR|nr:ubiquitin conjugating enzyme ATG3 like [Trichuris trichiura]
MESLVNKLKNSALEIAEYLSPVLKESRFRESGVITPDEFVSAGDHLTLLCPTWQWAKGDEAQMKPYLPANKQFLITRNGYNKLMLLFTLQVRVFSSLSVPCYQRSIAILYSANQEKVIESDDSDDGWVDTHHFAVSQFDASQATRVMMNSFGVDDNTLRTTSSTVVDDEPETAAVDMDRFFQEGFPVSDDNANQENDDPNIGPFRHPATDNLSSDGAENVWKTRTYDLTITYDKYYQVPRMWLSGYDEASDKKPLTVDQMYEDFSQDHVKKTITMGMHPHLPGPPMASIHPCRHAETMKRLIDTFAENGKEFDVHQYLVVFLKFVQAVIPTIEYDYSKNVTF